MTRQIISRALIVCVAGAAVLLTGCTAENRISQNPAIYQGLSPSDQALVSQAKIREGMTEGAVYLAWGSPDQRMVGRARGKAAETWIYMSAYHVSPGFGFYGGGGYLRHRGHYGYRHYGYYDPFYDPFFYSRLERVEYPSRTVSFQGGRVVGYQYLSPRAGAY